MSASLHAGYPRDPLRVGLAVLVGLQFLTEVLPVNEMSGRPPFSRRHDLLTRALPPSPPVLVAVSAVVFAGLLSFALGRRPVLAGLLSLGAMALVAQWSMELFGSSSHNAYFTAGMLLGWIGGVLYARALAVEAAAPPPDRAFEDELGEAGAVGIVAALYVGSAVTKLQHSGLAWAHADTLQSLILSQQGLADVAWVHAYRDYLVAHPSVTAVFSAATLVIEGGAFMMLVGRRWRVAWSLLIFGLHANIIVLCTMPYIEPMVFVLLAGLPWPTRLRRRHDPDRAAWLARPVPSRVLAVIAVLFALACTLPVGWRPFEGDNDFLPDRVQQRRPPG